MGEADQGKGEGDEENIEYSRDSLLSRFKDHTRHQAAGSGGDTCKDCARISGLACVEVKESQGADHDERGGNEGSNGNESPKRAAQVVADVDREANNVGARKKLHKGESRQELVIREPAFLTHDKSTNVGCQSSPETRHADEGKESGKFGETRLG